MVKLKAVDDHYHNNTYQCPDDFADSKVNDIYKSTRQQLIRVLGRNMTICSSVN